MACKLHASFGILEIPQFKLCSSDQHKFIKNRKVPLQSQEHWKRATHLQHCNRYLHSETNVTSGKLLFPLPSYLHSPHTIPTNFCKKPGQSSTASVKRDNSPQSHGQILTMLMFLCLLGSSPPFSWIKCNVNCTLRCDGKATPRIPQRFQTE